MDLEKLKNTLRDTGILEAIKSVCGDGNECFLVGGAIRDFLLEKKLNDFDFCFPEDPTPHAEQIAAKLGASWFVLDKERGHSRFVLKHGEERIVCDFAPFRAPSLESDLRKRDFTINAIALSCHNSELDLIDPLGGQQDLTAGRLRCCGEYAFQEDPLRCLKGIRHAVALDLEFEPETLLLLTDAVSQIDQVASERIKAELAKAIDCSNSTRTFELLKQTNLVNELFGHSSPEAFANAIAMLHRFDELIQKLKKGTCGQIVNEYLAENCEEYVSIEVALKMAAFFHGYRPVALKSLLQALRFSKRTVNLVEQLQKLGPESLTGIDQIAKKNRSRARWLSTLGNEPLAIAIFMTMLASTAEKDELLLAEILIESFTTCAKQNKLAELVDGDWLSTELGIEEGPVMGEIYGKLHLAELNGEVTTSDEARKWLLTNQKVIDKDFNG